jgi:hypothetical protein
MVITGTALTFFGKLRWTMRPYFMFILISCKIQYFPRYVTVCVLIIWAMCSPLPNQILVNTAPVELRQHVSQHVRLTACNTCLKMSGWLQATRVSTCQADCMQHVSQHVRLLHATRVSTCQADCMQHVSEHVMLTADSSSGHRTSSAIAHLLTLPHFIPDARVYISSVRKYSKGSPCKFRHTVLNTAADASSHIPSNSLTNV